MNPEFIMWRRSNRILHGWIVGSLIEEVLGIVVGLETLSHVWKAFADYFAQSIKYREFYLIQKLHLHNRDNFKTISDYFQEFKEICDGLVGIGFPIDNQQKVLIYSKG